MEIGRPFRTSKYTIYERIKIIIPSTPEARPFEYWAAHARCKLPGKV